MELKTPLSGVVMYMQNYSQGWMNAKPFQVGDQVWPGGVVAEIPDLATLEMEGKVEEIDRGRISVGQDTRVHIDSLPELTMPADLVAISPLTEQTFEWPRTSSFRAYGHIRQPDPRLRPAMNGNMDVIVSRIPNAISIPAKACSPATASPWCMSPEKGAYRAVDVELLARNPDEVAVKGISAGTMVTLVERSRRTRRNDAQDRWRRGCVTSVLGARRMGRFRLMKAMSPSSRLSHARLPPSSAATSPSPSAPRASCRAATPKCCPRP